MKLAACTWIHYFWFTAAIVEFYDKKNLFFCWIRSLAPSLSRAHTHTHAHTHPLHTDTSHAHSLAHSPNRPCFTLYSLLYTTDTYAHTNASLYMLDVLLFFFPSFLEIFISTLHKTKFVLCALLRSADFSILADTFHPHTHCQRTNQIKFHMETKQIAHDTVNWMLHFKPKYMYATPNIICTSYAYIRILYYIYFAIVYGMLSDDNFISFRISWAHLCSLNVYDPFSICTK